MGSLPNREETLQILEEAYSVEGARRALREHLTFSHEWQYDIVLIWAAQAHLAEVLPDECVNLAFSGAKSSGKTTATWIAAHLAGGAFFGGGSLAAMIRAFDANRVVGIDEVDANNRRLRYDLEGILRICNRWNAIYPLMRRTKGGFAFEDLEVGGPKVFNFRSKVEDALRSRTWVIEMPRQKDARQAIANLFLENPTTIVKDWLAARAAERVREWSKDKVKAHMEDPAFIARLEALPAALGRDQAIAAVFLVISDIMELDLDGSIRQAQEARGEEEESYEEIREHLRELYRSEVRRDGDECKIAVMDAKVYINRELSEAGSPYTLSNAQFARVRREFGFQEGINVKKISREGGKRFLIFDKMAREALGLEGEGDVG